MVHRLALQITGLTHKLDHTQKCFYLHVGARRVAAHLRTPRCQTAVPLRAPGCRSRSTAPWIGRGKRRAATVLGENLRRCPSCSRYRLRWRLRKPPRILVTTAASIADNICTPLPRRVPITPRQRRTVNRGGTQRQNTTLPVPGQNKTGLGRHIARPSQVCLAGLTPSLTAVLCNVCGFLSGMLAMSMDRRPPMRCKSAMCGALRIPFR